MNGAVAILQPGGAVELHDVPTRKDRRGEAYLAADMANLLRCAGPDAFCILEDVSLRPGESGRNGLKIGRGAGLWEGILAALGIAYEIVPALTWKREFRITDSSLSDADRKKLARARAIELFHQLQAELSKRRPDFAEALLLAEYGRRRRSGRT